MSRSDDRHATLYISNDSHVMYSAVRSRNNFFFVVDNLGESVGLRAVSVQLWLRVNYKSRINYRERIASTRPTILICARMCKRISLI
jgi:hypothetical protein